MFSTLPLLFRTDKHVILLCITMTMHPVFLEFYFILRIFMKLGTHVTVKARRLVNPKFYR